MRKMSRIVMPWTSVCVRCCRLYTADFNHLRSGGECFYAESDSDQPPRSVFQKPGSLSRQSHPKEDTLRYTKTDMENYCGLIAKLSING